MVPRLVRDILCHHATQNISPHTTLHIARLALLHRENHSEPLVALAKNITRALESEAWSTVMQKHPRLPPSPNIQKLTGLVPLFKEWDTKIPQDVLDMALHDAVVWEEPLETLQCLIRAGANVNAITETAYFSPLMIAARKGRADIVTILLDAGAIRHLNVDGHTALSLATTLDVRALLAS